MDNYEEILDIKSVNVRSITMKRRPLMSSSMVRIFESFLKESIGNEVLVVNTNIGMEIYYYSKTNYSTFIKESILLYTLKSLDHTKLKFRYHLSRDEVYQSFCQALMTFAQYPQIFLAYAKKFIYLQKKNESSKYVIPILNDFFEEVLKFLNETGKIPHYEKIERAKRTSRKPDPDKMIIKDLIAEILLRKHHN